MLRGPKRRLQRGDSVQYRLNNGLWWALYTVETTDSFKREIKATYGRMRKYEHVVEALNEYQFRSLHHRSQGVSRQAHNSESGRQYRVKWKAYPRSLKPLIPSSDARLMIELGKEVQPGDWPKNL